MFKLFLGLCYLRVLVNFHKEVFFTKDCFAAWIKILKSKDMLQSVLSTSIKHSFCTVLLEIILRDLGISYIFFSTRLMYRFWTLDKFLKEKGILGLCTEIYGRFDLFSKFLSSVNNYDKEYAHQSLKFIISRDKISYRYLWMEWSWNV